MSDNDSHYEQNDSMGDLNDMHIIVIQMTKQVLQNCCKYFGGEKTN